MDTQRSDWTEADLQHLIGQPKSFTLEFKPSKICSLGTVFSRNLSKDLSAFANAEGGTIVLGIQDNRGRPKTALNLDEGLDPTKFSLEQLQHTIDCGLRPHLPGILCHTVPLSGENAGRVAYVITVPKGETAYQASDNIYYSRNGFRNEPIHDRLIRLLMFRDQTATVALEVGNCEILPHDDQDEYRFDLVIVNTSSRSIEDFLISLKLVIQNDELQLWAPTMFVDNEEDIRNELKSVESMLEIGEDIEEYKRYEILQGPGIPFQSGDELRCSFRRIMQLLYQVDGTKIFPQDRLIFPGGKWLIKGMPHGVPLAAFQPRLHWTIYLDNAAPCTGEIEIGPQFQS